MTEVIPYGAWPSEISAASVVEGVVGFSELKLRGDDLFWLESRPQQQGRTVLMKLAADGTREELTPSPFNVRSRVHEYGGGAYCLSAEQIFFCNFSDQNLYCIDTTGKITQLTHSDANERFADCCVDVGHNRLLCVLERHAEHPDQEPGNYLAGVDLKTGEVEVLHAQYDFYASPRLNPAGDTLVVVAWSHPNMPWDGSLLLQTTLNDNGDLNAMTVLAGGADESITQPGWLDDGALLFISDQNGFYNLHRFDDQGIRCLLADGADYAQPAWVFGGSEYAAIDNRHLAAIRQSESGPELVVIDMESGMASPIAGAEDDWCQFGSLAAVGNRLTFIAGFSDRLPAIERFDIASRERKHLVSASEQTSTVPVSEAQALAFPTRDGAVAHGFFYPPWNDHCQPPTNTIPPLLVMSHGGPTAATSAALNPRIQYYTSRGWAVFDVNYRGSSGFGRQYRTALNGRWGELDVWDCEDGVRYLISQGLVDPAHIAIRGGSAGGFTTLAALTTTATFRCGASHYGIGDLTALVADTHKFESRYMHTLLADEANLVARSPINHLDGLSCPVIFFQGGADQVVPENQAQTMVQALQDKGIPVAYLLFPEEGHGFRSAENIIRALESEFAFFSRIFNITPADELPDVEILNMPQGQS